MTYFPEEVVEHIFDFLGSHRDRNAVSTVCKAWYHVERLSRLNVFVGNCYAIRPERVMARFPGMKSLSVKGKPHFADYNLVPYDWGGFALPWIKAAVRRSPGLEDLRLKRMVVTDDDLDLLARSFPNFRSLVLVSCEGFSTDGLAAIATYCRGLRELDLQENEVEDHGRQWLSCFHESCTSLVSLNFACLKGEVNAGVLERLVARCPNLRSLKLNRAVSVESLNEIVARAPYLVDLGTGSFAVLDCIGDKGLAVVASTCKELQELRVFPSDIYGAGATSVTEEGLVAISSGCPKLNSLLYFCYQMTNAALITVAKNCPHFTRFRLCILDPWKPDPVTNQPLDEGFGAIVRSCKNLRRLSLSGLLTDQVFLYIGLYAKCLEMLSIAFAGDSDKGMVYILKGCKNLRKLEIRDCPFGDIALLNDVAKYETMRSLWMSSCDVTLGGCKALAAKMPRLNVEIINESEGTDKLEENISDLHKVEKMYVYRTVAGPRNDAPDFVWTL
ncbi:hypothetical protein C4D60_Mb10t17730 [Musa balbisiana]|uniref:F-box domain-containing protein n=1 Tax=Musa balbisiana TaxID=52838 RepID=A0A4S8IXW3_MUSBA|nr:hypothetical protein C4D60_Mb10t17730 [Musa balbisiana]